MPAWIPAWTLYSILYSLRLYSLSNCLGLTDADLADAQPVAHQHFQAYAVAVDTLAGLGHAAQPFADQAAHGGGFDIFLAVEGGHQVGDAVEIEASGDDETAGAVLGDVAIGLVLVADFSDDDFQQVFHGGQAGGVAVLVHHDHHVAVLLLHLAHQVAHRLGLRHHADGAHQFADGAMLALFSLQLEHVAHVDEADHPVDGLLVDRNARVLLRDDELAQLLQGGIGGNEGFDVFRRSRFVGGRDGIVRQVDQRLEEFEQGHARARDQREEAEQRNQREEPPAAGAAVEQLGQRERDRNHGEHDGGDGLPEDRGVPGGVIREPGEVENAEAAEQGVFDQREGARAILGRDADPVFERLLEEFQRGQVAGTETQAFEVKDLHESHQREQRNGDPQDDEQQNHDRTRSIRPLGRPSLARQRFSARAMAPESVS